MEPTREVTTPAPASPQSPEHEEHHPEQGPQRCVGPLGPPSDNNHQSQVYPQRVPEEPLHEDLPRDEDNGADELEDDTQNDPDYGSHNVIPEENIQVRQSRRVRQPKKFEDFFLY